MRTICFYITFFFILLVKTPSLILLNAKKNKMEILDFYNESHKHAKKWSSKLIKVSGAKVTVNGYDNIPKDEAVLFISNHQGNFDIPLFLTFIDKEIGFVAKTELLKVPLIRSWMKNIGCVFINRDDLKQSAKTILEGISILKSGHSMLIFPEGTRSNGDELGEFKAGSFKLATKPKITIVPITVDGSYKLMKKKTGKITPNNVTITIHKPIYTKDLNSEEIKELPIKVKEIIESVIK